MDKLTSAAPGAKTTDAVGPRPRAELPVEAAPGRATLALDPRRTTPSVGVYVHFPWCVKKCPYCDFLSVPVAQRDIPHQAYADAVLAELAARRAELGPLSLRSVFFGGGTPSMWQAAQLGRV